MNEHVDPANPVFTPDRRGLASATARVPLLVIDQTIEGRWPWPTLIEHARQRRKASLHDGRTVTLIGVDREGRRGEQRYTTVHITDDRHRHHRINPAQISYLIGATP